MRSHRAALTLLIPALTVHAVIPFDDEHLDGQLLRRAIITEAELQRRSHHSLSYS